MREGRVKAKFEYTYEEYLMKGLTVLHMTSMMGMRNISFTKEELLELNSQLNKIKRPR